MSTENNTPSPEAVAQATQNIADQIAAGIAAGINEARPKKITIGQFNGATPWQSDKRTAKKLNMTWLQNGARMPEKRMNNKEIALLNQIHRSGRYIDRLVEVIVREEGNDKLGELRYKNASIDDRMNFRSNVRNLEHMLQQIVDEQTRLDEEDGVQKEIRKSFSSKNTEAARARANQQ
jgi:hypothetical protein